MLAYVDTSILIPYIEDKGKYKNGIEFHLTQLKQSGWQFCISQAVILEALYKPYRDKNIELIKIYNKLFANIKIIPDYSNLLGDSIQIMKKENVKAMDAIHVALAKHHGCDGFVTTDPHFKNLTSISPFWIDLADV